MRAKSALILAFLSLMLILVFSYAALEDFPASLSVYDVTAVPIAKAQLFDRHSRRLSITYQNRWNITDVQTLAQFPSFLQQSFLLSEDAEFYSHGGVDWRARFAALYQSLRALRVVRGASTITEQVVRMWHPRKRTLWSRWLEGIEAGQLEKRFSKADILEFYLNQVPYASNRRGLVQAANYYFNRDLDTLSKKEMLALVVMVRSPSLYVGFEKGAFRKQKVQSRLEKGVENLARRLQSAGVLDESAVNELLGLKLTFASLELSDSAEHFVRYVLRREVQESQKNAHIVTSLDLGLQQKVSRLLKARLSSLQEKNVGNAAALVIDHQRNEVLAWVNESSELKRSESGEIDAVTTERQPGSTLKPFLYALALEKGWTAASLIDDAPLSKAVGSGLHSYRNYSRQYYGPIRLRLALGNSLNVPAVRAIAFVGVSEFYKELIAMGISSLSKPASYYGEGLALGNAELSLWELLQAYAVLARGGVYQSLSYKLDQAAKTSEQRRIFSPESSSLIANILADSNARQLEFGGGSLLRFPVQTAVKTGTSSDYRDAWALGFSDRYSVGVWMGNLDRAPMREVSGSLGPALVLRSIFAELRRLNESKALFISPKLSQHKICALSGRLAAENCALTTEFFKQDQVPLEKCPGHDIKLLESISYKEAQTTQEGLADMPTAANPTLRARITLPTPGLHIALDPRIPDDKEAFAFTLEYAQEIMQAQWFLDGQLLATTPNKKYLWHPVVGKHELWARVFVAENQPQETQSVVFYVSGPVAD